MSRAERRAAWIPVGLAVGFMVPIAVDGPTVPFVLGVPFNFAWCVFMVIATSVALGIAYRCVRSGDA